ncbi:Uncharacterised protein [Mycobacteroides abscessus subsp. abscessus]|nr:Uncharacterised protein [Mycobacteroides abscessus subsp. abscessus]
MRLDASLVRLDKCLGDRQPDTCSTVLPIAGGIGAIEAIEQSVQMLGRNSVAGVGDGDRGAGAGRCRRHGDLAAWAGVT